MSAGNGQRARRNDAVEFVATIRGHVARGLRRRGDHARRRLERWRTGPPRSPAPAPSAGIRSSTSGASEPVCRAICGADASAACEGRRGAAARSRSSADAAQREPETDERMRPRVGSAEKGGQGYGHRLARIRDRLSHALNATSAPRSVSHTAISAG